MITLIFSTNPHISSVLIDDLDLIKVNTEETYKLTIHKNSGTILFECPKNEKDFRQAILYAYSEYNPDILLYVGESTNVSTEIRNGDIILPNVLFEYNSEISEAELGHENRDNFSAAPLFLENYDLQSDYDFDHFGLRVGGIVVTSPQKLDFESGIIEKIRIAYEADVVDDFSYYFVEESKKLNILEKTYVLLGVLNTHETITLTHLSHIVNFLVDNFKGEQVVLDSLDIEE